MLEQFIRNWLSYSLNPENRVFDRDDNAMIDMMEGRQPFNYDIVSRWSHRYRILNRIDIETKNALILCAKTNIAHNQRISSSENYPDKTFRIVYEKFHQINDRKWLSLTSKYLWCKFPNNFPMYDRFAYRAVCNLQSIHPVLINLSPVGRENPNGVEAVCAHYSRYRAHVMALTEHYTPLINEIKQELNCNYPYNLRIMDKILWSLGNGTCGAAPPPVTY